LLATVRVEPVQHPPGEFLELNSSPFHEDFVMANILIAGCGDVGSALGQRLSASGHQVWGLKRHPADLPPGIQPLAADLTDPATLTALPRRWIMWFTARLPPVSAPPPIRPPMSPAFITC
jgi:hypothetical protein